MKASKLYIGAFALIVCAIAAFAVTSAEPADATPGADIDVLAADIDLYALAVLGTDEIVSAEAENDELTITVNTSSAAIDDSHLNFRGILTKFKGCFGDVNVWTKDANSGEIKIISGGEPTSEFDTFLARVVTGLKAALAGESSEYVGQIRVDGNEYRALTVSFVLSNEFKEVASALSSVRGTPAEIMAAFHLTDGVFKAFGINVDEIGDYTLSEVFDAFAKGKGASAIFSNPSTASYFDVLCDMINHGDYFDEFLTNNIDVMFGTADMDIDSVTMSTDYGFNGLMATLASATAGFEKKISEIADVIGGTVSFDFIKVIFLKGIEGDEFDWIGINMDVIYSEYKINVYAEASEGGTATIGGKDSITGYAGTPFTVTATPDSGYTISSIVYYVGDKKVDSLGSSTRANTFIHFEEGLAHSVVVTFNEDTPVPPAPPTPVPPAPDDPDEPEDLPDDGTVVNPDGSITTTTTDEETGIKSSVTEKGGKVTKVVSETETGTKYSSVGEGSTVTTTVWSSDMNEFMVDALTEQASLITGGKTAELVIVSTEVNINADAAEDIADAFRTVTLTNADAHMEIPAGIMKNLAKDGKLKITSKQATSSDMTEKQRSVVGNNYVLKLTATAGTTTVHELGDSVTISFNYIPTTSMSGKHLVVCYVDDDGKTTDMQTTYANGRVTFTTDHFSVYFVNIVEDTPGGGGSSSSSHDNILYIAAIAAAAVAAIAVCIVAMVYFKKD